MFDGFVFEFRLFVRFRDNGAEIFLADCLAVAEPLAKVTDLTDVIGVVKSVKCDSAAKLAIESWWTFRGVLFQHFCRRLLESVGELGRDLLPCGEHFFSRRICSIGLPVSAARKK